VRRDRHITCRRCHSKMSSGRRFCDTCGASIPLDARQPIPTHGAPWTLFAVTTLPLLVIFAISVAVAFTSTPQSGNAAVTEEPTLTTDPPEKDSSPRGRKTVYQRAQRTAARVGTGAQSGRGVRAQEDR